MARDCDLREHIPVPIAIVFKHINFMLRVMLWKVSFGPMITQPMYNETNLFLTTIECFFGLMHGWLAGNAKTHSKIVSWKVLSGLKRKTFLSKDFSKRRAILLFELSLWKSRCKYLHIQLRKCCVFAGPRRKKGASSGLYPPTYPSYTQTTN